MARRARGSCNFGKLRPDHALNRRLRLSSWWIDPVARREGPVRILPGAIDQLAQAGALFRRQLAHLLAGLRQSALCPSASTRTASNSASQAVAAMRASEGDSSSSIDRSGMWGEVFHSSRGVGRASVSGSRQWVSTTACGASCLCLHWSFGHCHTGPDFGHFSTM